LTASKPISIRLDADLLARIDAVAEGAGGGPLSVKVKRSEAIRALILTALPMAEAAVKNAGSGKPGVRRAKP
jgi:metal-responsive CopG/Arc/MetJ family transcriptional regulator